MQILVGRIMIVVDQCYSCTAVGNIDMVMHVCRLQW